jgi:hypothetical protein
MNVTPLDVTAMTGGFTALPYAVTSGDHAFAAYLVPPAPGTFQATWALSASDGWDAVIMTLAP